MAGSLRPVRRRGQGLAARKDCWAGRRARGSAGEEGARPPRPAAREDQLHSSVDRESGSGVDIRQVQLHANLYKQKGSAEERKRYKRREVWETLSIEYRRPNEHLWWLELADVMRNPASRHPILQFRGLRTFGPPASQYVT